MLDAVGYSTAPEDVPTAQTRLGQFIDWLLGLPWWLPWSFAFLTTALLIWVSWPRYTPAAVSDAAHVPQPTKVDNLPIVAKRADETPDLFLDALQGEPHERLELFIIDFIAPAVWTQYEIQREVLRLLCPDESIFRYAALGLGHGSLYQGHFETALSLGGSPLPELTNRQMIECITGLENGTYWGFCTDGASFAESHGIKPQHHEALKELWEQWRARHNKLVAEYDKLKRESRFPTPLYRPQRQSRWGGIVGATET